MAAAEEPSLPNAGLVATEAMPMGPPGSWPGQQEGAWGRPALSEGL